MNFIYPVEPMSRPWAVDPDFQAEYQLVSTRALIDFELLLNGDIERAIRRVDFQGKTVMRGWQMATWTYADLYLALKENLGVELINSPHEYMATHDWGIAYETLKNHTAQTVFVDDLSQMDDELRVFGNKPLIVKDTAKSAAKYDWLGKTFIPSATNRDKLWDVVRGFLSWRGKDYTGRLVFKEYLHFDLYDGKPIEYRCFIYNGKIISTMLHPDQRRGMKVQIERGFSELLQEKFAYEIGAIGSNFWTMDVAISAKDGQPMIVEVGDGQVSEIRAEHKDANLV